MDILSPELKRSLLGVTTGLAQLSNDHRKLLDLRELLEPPRAVIDEIIITPWSSPPITNEIAELIG